MKDKFDYAEAQEKRLNAYAFPGRQMALIAETEMEVATQGLTKREYFAGLMMQSIVANDDRTNFKELMATHAVEFADALLKELKKPQ